MTMTLSLADIARLADVQRPVVSMWRKRPLLDAAFPDPDDAGRFDAGDVASWLERTGRGNNPEVRADLALHASLSAANGTAHLAHLHALVAARALLDVDLSELTLDDLLDEIEEVDPDDVFIAGEVRAIGRDAFAALAREADALVDAAWHARNAYEKLSDSLARDEVGHDERLDFDLIDVMAALSKALMSDEGTLVDVDGTCSDVAVAILSDEDHATPQVVVPASGEPARSSLRRYRLHGTVPQVCELDDDWPLSGPTVALSRVGGDAERAVDDIDELVLHLPPHATAIVVGPATTLIDPLSGRAQDVRDRLLRERVIRAAVRLPAGLTRGGTRSQLAVWVLSHPRSAASDLLATDLSGSPLTRTSSQQLLDDLLSAAEEGAGHAYSLLRRANVPRILAQNLPLTATPQQAATLPDLHKAADDAVRMLRLRESLLAEPRDPFPYLPTVGADASPGEVRLGDAVREGSVRLLPGSRLRPLPHGTMRLWTTESVGGGTADSVDRLALTTSSPRFRITEPMDVVFTTQGRPRAVIDAEGGAAVAYPARVIRSRDPRLRSSVIAAAINAQPESQSVWRTWSIPLSSLDRDLADELLAHLDSYSADLRTRQTELEELRRLVTRSVLSGAVLPTHSSNPDEKGH